jgi:ABC-type dipeptide/oligopeptide/nickel transport system permease subunit
LATVDAAKGAVVGATEAVASGSGGIARSPWSLAGKRLLHDRVALCSAVFILFLFAFAAAAPAFENLTGHPVNKSNVDGTDDLTLLPVGPMHGCHVGGQWLIGSKGCFILGASNVRGNDMLVQLAYGARTSLFIGFTSTLLLMLAALFFGLIAGFFGGLSDTIISRVIDVIAAFPFLLFAIAMSVTFGASRATVIGIIAFFGWFYPARIFRADVLGLREREFISAARMLGASNGRILFRHIMPHLMGPAIVYATLSISVAIGFEAALSYLGFGLPVDVPSWGRMISDAVPGGLYRNDPHLMVFPGTLLVLTVLAFNLLGDGLRDAFDPRGSGSRS